MSLLLLLLNGVVRWGNIHHHLCLIFSPLLSPPTKIPGYGAFWIAFSFLNIFKAQNVYVVTDNEVGAFLTGFAIFTFVLFVASLRRSKMEVALFFTLLLGLIFASIQVRMCEGVWES